MRFTRRCHSAVLCAAAVLAAAVPVMAGAPLLCPEMILSESEVAALDKACNAAAGKKESAESFVRTISASAVPRFRIEGIRWFFHREGADRGALLAALDRRVTELGERATPQDRFDAALAAVIADWEGDRAKEAVATLCEIADETGDPVRLIIAAEGLDLVAGGRSKEERRYASLLGLAHCRRAAAALAKPASDEDREAARLLRTHLPYLRGTHSRDPAWVRFTASLEEQAAER